MRRIFSRCCATASDAAAILLVDVLRKPVFFAAESQKIGVLASLRCNAAVPIWPSLWTSSAALPAS